MLRPLRKQLHVAQMLAAAAADDAMELEEKLFERPEDYETRRGKQIDMPAFPTTTIGSFPQTNGDQLAANAGPPAAHLVIAHRQLRCPCHLMAEVAAIADPEEVAGRVTSVTAL
jgi:hypothetical protein